MKTADLYIRVSTDEQADKGYSQRNQEEILTRYCSINGITVRHVVYEDYSAKTFNRPRWQALLQMLKKNRGRTNLLLFVKWDRFSRNAGDAYQMINLLRSLGVEPQAIEQPLDLTIPENKMMLAFYLAAPEVENDRRSLNVFFGMRRAKKEGRWMGSIPLGYVNKVDERGKKYIEPIDKDAEILKWAFAELAKGIYSADQIRKQVNKKGLECSRSNFWRSIRNPVYCGKIFIPAHKEEEEMVVQGLHQGIISEDLFYVVQDVLSGRQRQERKLTQFSVFDLLPLRGFLQCHKCGQLLTGSASKGRTRLYYYYHCHSKCGVRFKAEFVNNVFEDELSKHTIPFAYNQAYAALLKERLNDLTKDVRSERNKIMEQIEIINNRLKNGRILVVDEKMDHHDFRVLKEECIQRITELEAKLATTALDEKNYNEMVDKGISNLARIRTLYIGGDSAMKRQIIGSMFPEKIVFDGKQHRITKVNEAVRLIVKLGEGFREIKNRKRFKDLSVSGMVPGTGIEPVFPP